MRIAVLSDIHGNVHALNRCLDDLRERGGADVVVAAGDLCLDGPKPEEGPRAARRDRRACLRGNTDRMIGEADLDAARRRGRARGGLGARARSARSGTRALAELPFSLTLRRRRGRPAGLPRQPQVRRRARLARRLRRHARAAVRRRGAAHGRLRPPAPALRARLARPHAGQRRVGRACPRTATRARTTRSSPSAPAAGKCSRAASRSTSTRSPSSCARAASPTSTQRLATLRAPPLCQAAGRGPARVIP